MSRVVVFLCIACVCAAPPAFSQQADPPASPPSPPASQSNPPASQSDDLIDLLDARFCELVRAGDHTKLTGGLCGPIDIPVPNQQGARLFADAVDIYSDKNLLIAEGNVSFTTPEGRINADRIEFNLEDGTAAFHHA